MSKKKNKARRLAEAIGKDLMTMHGSTEVTVERIALMKKQKDGTEKNLGGRCFKSVVSVIWKHLAADDQ